MNKYEEIAKVLAKAEIGKKPKKQAVTYYHSIITYLNNQAENTKYIALCNPKLEMKDTLLENAKMLEHQALMTEEGAKLFLKYWVLNEFAKKRKNSKLLSKLNLSPNALRTFSETVDRIFEICKDIRKTRYDEPDPDFEITEDEKILVNLNAISRDANVVYSEMSKDERLNFSTKVLAEVTKDLSEAIYNKETNTISKEK